MIAADVPFRYHDADHSYWLGDVRIPGISELLERGGYNTAAAFYTDAGRERGTSVHALLADLDMGVVDGTEAHPHRSYALGYLDIRKRLRVAWDGIEIALCSRGYRFGGRPDRIGAALGRKTVAEIKSGARNNERDGIQLALQAILAEENFGLPASMWQRLGLYPKKSGKFEVFEFEDARDFDKAHALLKEFCR